MIPRPPIPTRTDPLYPFTSLCLSVVNFRTVVRNAAQIANRETVSVEEAGTRFLNISADSPLYTRIGRLLEKVALTELPQFTHVLRGQMSVIGNRPLPQNVMDCLDRKSTRLNSSH